jgi:hypothetical protein
MKTLLIVLASVGGLISLCSCSKQIHSHQQVMVSYHTKDDVLKQFGVPDEKREANHLTEWLYNCDTASALHHSKTKVVINGTYNTVYGSLNHNTVTTDKFTPYNQYVKFTFDEQGKVVNWDSDNVNFEERKKKRGATIALVAGSAAAATLLILSLIVASDFSNWGN